MVDLALHAQFQRARSLWLSLALTRDLAWSLAFFLASGPLAFHLDRLFVLPATVRLIWSLGTLALTALLLVGRGWWAARHRPDDRAVALGMERRHPHLRERLLSAVELARLPEAERARYSAGLLAAVQEEAEAAAHGLDFRQAVTWRQAYPALATCAVLLLFTALHVALAPQAMAAWWGRMTRPGADIPVYRNTRVRISPRQALLLRGNDLALKVETEGRPVQRAQLHFRVGGGDWTRVALREPFLHRLQGLGETTEYYATAGDGQSDRGVARVVDAPAVVGLRLRYQFPAYMARPEQTVSGVSGALSVPVGTEVDLAVTASKPLQEAAMGAGSTTEALAVNGATATGRTTVWEDTKLALRLKDTDGFGERAPRSVEFHAVPDAAPDVRLARPTADLDVVADASVPLQVTAADDYGLHQLWLAHRVERAGALAPAGARLSLARGHQTQRSLEVQARWNLDSLGLRPGDLVVYRAEANDFDDLRGPHVGRSAEQRLRVVDRAEMERRLAEGWQEWDRQLGEVSREQTAARAALQAARTPAALAEAERRQRDLAPRAGDLAQQAAGLVEMARMNRLSTEQTLTRQERASAELADIARRAMPQAADRIRDGARQEAEARQAQISRRLEALRQQAQADSDLEELARRAEELARAQSELQGQSQRLLPATLGMTPAELATGQRGELARMRQSQTALQQATGQFESALGRAARRAIEQAVAAARLMRERTVPERQGQAARQVERNLLARAASGQQAVAADLRRVAALLRQTAESEELANASQQQALERARRQAERMLSQQTNLTRRTAQQRANSAQNRQLSRQQRALRDQAQRLQQQLQRQGLPSRPLRDAQQQMSQAQQRLQQNSPQQARPPQEQAQQSLREMVQQLQEALSERQADAAMQRLQRDLSELVRRQGNVNRSLQRTDQAPDQSRAARQLAPRQEAVSRSAQGVEQRLPSETFRQAMEQARAAMQRAGKAMRQGEAGEAPRADGRQAERLLQQMARALEEQRNASPQAGQQQGQQQGQANAQSARELARRLADLRLLRALEQALRGETGEADQQSEGQQERLRGLAGRQAQTRRMTERAGQGLQRFPGVGRRVGEAAGAMGQAQQGLQQGSAGQQTQGAQGTAISRLTQAIGQGQQQLQAMQQQGMQPGNQAGNQQRNRGQQPALDSVAVRGSDEGGPRALVAPGGRGFGLLSPGDQRALRQGSREKIPADYADLIRRYYRALSERGR